MWFPRKRSAISEIDARSSEPYADLAREDYERQLDKSDPLLNEIDSQARRPRLLGGWLNAQVVPSALSARRWMLTAAGRPERSHFFLVQSGTVAARLDSCSTILQGPAIIWAASAAGDFVEYAAGASGATFSAENLMLRRIIEAGADAATLRRFWTHSLSVAGPQLDAIAAELRVSLAVLTREVLAPQRASEALAAAHLTILLLHLWREAEPARTTVGPSDERSMLIQRFFGLVETHFLEHWTVARYARSLGISDDRLHAVCLRVTGRGPLAHIHHRSIETARTRLLESGLPVEDIAAELGFADPGYFNRFFKRHVGQSPGVFRRRAIAARLDASSFASWP